MDQRVSDYRIRRIADRGNEEDGPDSRARGEDGFSIHRFADRGSDGVYADAQDFEDFSYRRITDRGSDKIVFELQDRKIQETGPKDVIWDEIVGNGEHPEEQCDGFSALEETELAEPVGDEEYPLIEDSIFNFYLVYDVYSDEEWYFWFGIDWCEYGDMRGEHDKYGVGTRETVDSMELVGIDGLTVQKGQELVYAIHHGTSVPSLAPQAASYHSTLDEVLENKDEEDLIIILVSIKLLDLNVPWFLSSTSHTFTLVWDGNNPYCNIELKGLHVIGKRLPLGSIVLEEEYGLVLHSGTTYVYLPKPVYVAFKHAIVKELQGVHQVRGPDMSFNDIFFSGAGSDVSQLSKTSLSVKMVLEKGKKLLLSSENYLFMHSRINRAYCLDNFQNWKRIDVPFDPGGWFLTTVKTRGRVFSEDGENDAVASDRAPDPTHKRTLITIVGFSSPAQTGIMDDLALSLEEYSVFGSILTIGAMLGAVMSGKIADRLGRRLTMGVSEMFCLSGWLAIIFSEVSWLLDVGRLLIGYGIGVLSYVVPVYIAEITPQNLRGAFTTVNQLMICTGVSVMWLIGTFIPWRVLALIGTIPCVVQIIGLFFIPESPRWLAKVGLWKNCESELHRLRGKNADIFEEAAEIRDYTEALDQLSEARVFDLFQPQYVKSLTIGVGLMVLQQFGGVNAIAFYVDSIFISAGFSSTIGSIAMVIVQVPFTLLGVILMDISGRRPLLLVSASGTCLGCFLTGASFLLQDLEESNRLNPVLALVGVLVFTGSFSLGMGGIPWVIMSEIFPINIKGSAGSLVTVVNWFGSWVVSSAFNFLMKCSSEGTFFLFSSICGLTVLFVAKLVPETKGRTLKKYKHP